MNRLYLDTSIFGGYFEDEFSFWTKLLVDKIVNKEIKIIYSRLTDIELAPAPKKVRDLVKMLPQEQLEFVDLTDESTHLAEKYLFEKVVGKSSRADCIHIALATIHKADVLVSWNFKHIVNLQRINGYNAVNSKSGYNILEIRTPREILYYEND